MTVIRLFLFWMSHLGVLNNIFTLASFFLVFSISTKFSSPDHVILSLSVLLINSLGSTFVIFFKHQDEFLHKMFMLFCGNEENLTVSSLF